MSKQADHERERAIWQQQKARLEEMIADFKRSLDGRLPEVRAELEKAEEYFRNACEEYLSGPGRASHRTLAEMAGEYRVKWHAANQEELRLIEASKPKPEMEKAS